MHRLVHMEQTGLVNMLIDDECEDLVGCLSYTEWFLTVYQQSEIDSGFSDAQAPLETGAMCW